MKISVIFVAGAQGCGVRDWNPKSCDFGEWIEKNLWESAVESFNFASENWEEFTNTVKSFDVTFDGYFQKLFRYLDSNGDSEISVEKFNGFFDRTILNGHFEEFSAKY